MSANEPPLPVAPPRSEPSADAALGAITADLAQAAWSAAAARCRSLLDADPACRAALYLAAAADIGADDLAQACDKALAAHRLDPDCPATAALLATIYALAGQLDTAVYYHKLARAGTPTPMMRLLPPGFADFDSAIATITDRPLLRRGMVWLAAGDLDAAMALLHQHLCFVPDDADATVALAGAQIAAGRPRGAVASLRAARHVRADDPRIAGLLGQALTELGSFAEARACHAVACRLAPDDPAVQAEALLDRLADPDQTAADIAGAVTAWTEQTTNKLPAGRGTITQVGNGRPLVVGFLVGRRGAAVDGPALADVLVERDRRRFSFVGFGGGSLAEPANVVFQKCMDRWQEVALDDPLTLAQMVRAEAVDIIVDASGFTAPRLLPALQARMAAVQVGWFDLPAVPRLAALDAVLTDAFIDPPAAAEAPGPVLLRLPGGSVVVPAAAAAAGGRRREDDRSDGVLFAADATLAELHPATVALWSEVLHRCPGAVLLLRDHGFTDPDTLAALLALFGSFGTSHRVDVVAAADPLAFFRSADVGLLARPLPRPATVAAMLAAGLPLVCPVGPSRSGRRAGSLLHHAGLAPDCLTADCLATTADGFVAKAVAWAGSAARRAAFRERLAAAPWSAAPAAMMRDIEDALVGLCATLEGDNHLSAAVVAGGR